MTAVQIDITEALPPGAAKVDLFVSTETARLEFFSLTARSILVSGSTGKLIHYQFCQSPSNTGFQSR